MKILYSLDKLLHPLQLTRRRKVVALVAALTADGLQLFLQAVPTAPQLIDVAASVIVSIALGFHVLLLPAFVIELVPVVNDLPTWTACVIVVIALRKRKERIAASAGR